MILLFHVFINYHIFSNYPEKTRLELISIPKQKLSHETPLFNKDSRTVRCHNPANTTTQQARPHISVPSCHRKKTVTFKTRLAPQLVSLSWTRAPIFTRGFDQRKLFRVLWVTKYEPKRRPFRYDICDEFSTLRLRRTGRSTNLGKCISFFPYSVKFRGTWMI